MCMKFLEFRNKIVCTISYHLLMHFGILPTFLRTRAKVVGEKKAVISLFRRISNRICSIGKTYLLKIIKKKTFSCWIRG